MSSLYKFEHHKSAKKGKKGLKAKLKEFQLISSNFKELSLRLDSTLKHSLSLKEVNKLRNQAKYIQNVDLSYNIIDKSKIGKSLALFLEKSKYLKLTYNSKALISDVEDAQERVTIFIRNFFFDENYYNDSDFSSYKSESPMRKMKPKRKSTNGLEMLLKASQKIDEGASSKNLRHSNSFLHNSNSFTPLRKFSLAENSSSLPANVQQEMGQSNLCRDVEMQGPNEDLNTSSIIDILLHEQRKTRSNS